MADYRCSAYSIYVPEKDAQLNGFLAAQSNVSMSVRLLLKCFLANCGSEYPDLSIMDLRELMNLAAISPEQISEELAVERSDSGKAHQRSIERQAAPEETIDMSARDDDIEDDPDGSDEYMSPAGEEPEDIPSDQDRGEGVWPEFPPSRNDAQDDAEPDDMPTPSIVSEPTRKERAAKSLRDAYNDSQNGDADTISAEDAIQSMMGDM